MEKVIFTDPDTKEKIEFYVLEETQINGKKFLFVTEEMCIRDSIRNHRF